MAILLGVTPSKGVTQKIEPFGRYPADTGLLLVHRQLQPLHDPSHLGQRPLGLPFTTDHQIVGIVDDASVEPLLMPQALPSQTAPPFERGDYIASVYEDSDSGEAAALGLFLALFRFLFTPKLPRLVHKKRNQSK